MPVRKPVAQPHLAVAVPLRTINAWIAQQVPGLRPMSLPAPRLAALLPQLARVMLRVRAAELLPTNGEGALLGVALEVQHAGVALVEMSARARLRPLVQGWQVSLALRPADIEALAPALAPGAREQIENALLQRLPELIRPLVPRGQVAPLADALVSYLGAQAYPLMRKALLSRLGQATSLTFDLPKVPLQRARLRTSSEPLPHLVIELHTPLPLRDGLLTYRVTDPELVQITVPGTLVAELGNCAMISGLLPRRYDGKLEPAAQGEHWPRFDWVESDPRPFKIVVTKTSSPCATVHLGARPRVELAQGKLVVGLAAGQVERIEGSALVQLGARLKDLGARPIALSHELVSQLVVRLGAQPLAFAVRGVGLDHGALVFGVHVGPPPPAPPAKQPATRGATTTTAPVRPPASRASPKPFELICWPR